MASTLLDVPTGVNEPIGLSRLAIGLSTSRALRDPDKWETIATKSPEMKELIAAPASTATRARPKLGPLSFIGEKERK